MNYRLRICPHCKSIEPMQHFRGGICCKTKKRVLPVIRKGPING